jgi:hypothetical protein
LGFSVWGLGFKVQNLGFGVLGVEGSTVQALGFRVWGGVLGEEELDIHRGRVRVSVLGFRV